MVEEDLVEFVGGLLKYAGVTHAKELDSADLTDNTGKRAMTVNITLEEHNKVRRSGRIAAYPAFF